MRAEHKLNETDGPIVWIYIENTNIFRGWRKRSTEPEKARVHTENIGNTFSSETPNVKRR